MSPKKFFPYIFSILFCLISKAISGSGGTHFTTGALAGKYFSFPTGKTSQSKILANSSALVTGVLSHVVMDYAHHYEPPFDPMHRDGRYFQIEGALSVILLIKAYKKDPRLFFGTLGGILPDLEHSLGLPRKYFPTHNGTLPELNYDGLGWGILHNFTLNLAAIYTIYHGPESHPLDNSPLMVGIGFSYQPAKTIYGNNQLFLPSFLIGYWLNHRLLFKHEFQTTLYKLPDNKFPDDFRPARRAITFNKFGLSIYKNRDNLISPFLGFSMGIAISNYMKAAEKGTLSLGKIEEKKFSFGIQAGTRLNITDFLHLNFYYSRDYNGIWDSISEVIDYKNYRLGINTSYGM